MYFSVDPKNDIRFLEKSIINFIQYHSEFFLLCSTEESKTLIIPIYCMYKGAYL